MSEDYLNDNVVIPDDIKGMNPEQLKEAIQKLEQELQSRKENT